MSPVLASLSNMTMNMLNGHIFTFKTTQFQQVWITTSITIGSSTGTLSAKSSSFLFGSSYQSLINFNDSCLESILMNTVLSAAALVDLLLVLGVVSSFLFSFYILVDNYLQILMMMKGIKLNGILMAKTLWSLRVQIREMLVNRFGEKVKFNDLF